MGDKLYCLYCGLVTSGRVLCRNCFDSYYPKEIPRRSSNREDACGLVLLFGKYKDKTLGEIYFLDKGYLSWLYDRHWLEDPLKKVIGLVLGHQ